MIRLDKLILNVVMIVLACNIIYASVGEEWLKIITLSVLICMWFVESYRKQELAVIGLRDILKISILLFGLIVIFSTARDYCEIITLCSVVLYTSFREREGIEKKELKD